MSALMFDGEGHYKGVSFSLCSQLYLIISEGSYDAKARLQISLVRNFVKTLLKSKNDNHALFQEIALLHGHHLKDICTV